MSRAVTLRNQRNHSRWDECLNALHETNTEDVYNAIERLVQAGEQVGFSVHDLIRMLNDGMSLENLLNLIELRMTSTADCESRVA
jgi:ABC-type cobalamin transport system ATPase subunit